MRRPALTRIALPALLALAGTAMHFAAPLLPAGAAGKALPRRKAAAAPAPGEDPVLQAYILKRHAELRSDYFRVGEPRTAGGRTVVRIGWSPEDHGAFIEEDFVVGSDPPEVVPAGGVVEGPQYRRDTIHNARRNARLLAGSTWTVAKSELTDMKPYPRRQLGLTVSSADERTMGLLGSPFLFVPDDHPQRKRLGSLRKGARLRFRLLPAPRKGTKGLNETDYLEITAG